MFLNPFEGDGFTLATLTDAINRVPFKPYQVGARLPWNAQGVTNRNIVIERKDGKLVLVPMASPGAPGIEFEGTKSELIPLLVPHFPGKVSVLASEVSGVRQFGSEATLETFEAKRDEKLAFARDSQDIMLEYSRCGALEGVVRDHDGTTKTDLFDKLGVQRSEQEFDLDDPTFDVIQAFIDAKEKSETALGAAMVEDYTVPMGGAIFRKITTHPSTRDSWREWNGSAALRADKRKGWEICEGVYIWSYVGQVQNRPFINADLGYLCPNAPGLYQTRFAPEDTTDFVNTLGIPVYAIPHPRPFNEGVDVKVSSNHVSWISQPDAIVRIKQG